MIENNLGLHTFSTKHYSQSPCQLVIWHKYTTLFTTDKCKCNIFPSFYRHLAAMLTIFYLLGTELIKKISTLSFTTVDLKDSYTKHPYITVSIQVYKRMYIRCFMVYRINVFKDNTLRAHKRGYSGSHLGQATE